MNKIWHLKFGGKTEVPNVNAFNHYFSNSCHLFKWKLKEKTDYTLTICVMLFCVAWKNPNQMWGKLTEDGKGVNIMGAGGWT